MSMEDFRKMVAKMEQHMQQLATQGLHEAPVIIDRMMGYAPELQKILGDTTDGQLMNLCNEFPEFYRCALIMEKAFEEECKKVYRPYDGITELSESHKKTMTEILTTTATLERGYQVHLESGKLSVLRSQVNDLDKLHRNWLDDLASFNKAIKEDSTVTKEQLDYIDIGLDHMAQRIAEVARLSAR